jgi:hypothetical protein
MLAILVTALRHAAKTIATAVFGGSIVRIVKKPLTDSAVHSHDLSETSITFWHCAMLIMLIWHFSGEIPVNEDKIA